jgi:hypothetical protein
MVESYRRPRGAATGRLSDDEKCDREPNTAAIRRSCVAHQMRGIGPPL